MAGRFGTRPASDPTLGPQHHRDRHPQADARHPRGVAGWRCLPCGGELAVFRAAAAPPSPHRPARLRLAPDRGERGAWPRDRRDLPDRDAAALGGSPGHMDRGRPGRSLLPRPPRLVQGLGGRDRGRQSLPRAARRPHDGTARRTRRRVPDLGHRRPRPHGTGPVFRHRGAHHRPGTRRGAALHHRARHRSAASGGATADLAQPARPLGCPGDRHARGRRLLRADGDRRDAASAPPRFHGAPRRRWPCRRRWTTPSRRGTGTTTFMATPPGDAT